MYGVLTFSVGAPTRVEKNMSIAVKNHATTTPESEELPLAMLKLSPSHGLQTSLGLEQDHRLYNDIRVSFLFSSSDFVFITICFAKDRSAKYRKATLQFRSDKAVARSMEYI
jgi:hypothetical protein